MDFKSGCMFKQFMDSFGFDFQLCSVSNWVKFEVFFFQLFFLHYQKKYIQDARI